MTPIQRLVKLLAQQAVDEHLQNSGRAMQPIQRAVINNTRNRHVKSSTLHTKNGNRSSCSRDELNLTTSESSQHG